MSDELSITVAPERLDEGSPEERACFGSIGIRYGNIWLTEGHDGFVNTVRSAPLLSAYHLAEWIAWNWWRLRWEPHSNAADWQFAHRLTTVGEGYVWPNITIFSDGERVALIAKSTRERSSTRFRYLSNAASVVSAREFEYQVDQFIEQVRGLLRDAKIEESNLDRIWNGVREERQDPNASKRRKIEALAGCDPGQVAESEIEQLMTDGDSLGELAMNEVAADYPQGGKLLTAKLLLEAADTNGFEAAPQNVVRLATGTVLPRTGEVPAWLLGAEAARALRNQEKLGTEPIENEVLVELAGVEDEVLTAKTSGFAISFALDNEVAKGRVVLRSKWETGRRFDLARLVGDRVIASRTGRLFPATRAHTYRQKMQRSFAAELLSPFETVDAMLAGDYSMENRQDIAEYFHVSEWTIRTLLVSHRRLEREGFEEDFDVFAA
ncbi:MAG: hypothetical protein JOZ29_00505 [Deltaproteobacteria bacterium]|nr:hypothetical protein [Deltaproteobacteria bacterium]MBV8450738.1 hypothetical protein [Deltaproteobacteria bacterium]